MRRPLYTAAGGVCVLVGGSLLVWGWLVKQACIMATCEFPRDNNAHALQWVISSVECLCAEFAASVGGQKEMVHLEMSTAKILDELQTSAIEHAKTEILLLSQLHGNLARLIDHCDNVLESPELVSRLKSFRKEIRALFSQPQRSTPSAVSTVGSTDTVAQRTTTPSEERNRPGHEEERSAAIVEVSEASLSKLKELMAEVTKEATSTSSDTNALRTRDRSKDNVELEKSGQIWVEEELNSATPAPTPPRRVPNVDQVRTSVNSLLRQHRARSPATSSNPASSDDEPQPKYPTESALEMMWPRSPCVMTVRARGKECRAQEAFPKKTTSQPEYPCWNFVAAVAGMTLLLLLIWTSMSTKGCHRHGRSFALGWRIICGVANVFCENYGLFCSCFCASGLQLEKWHCSR